MKTETRKPLIAKTLKPTPGPWSIELGHFANAGQIFIEGNESGNTHKQGVCQLGHAYDKDGNDLREVNARLIAQTPNLLAMCQASLKVFEAWKHDLNPHKDLQPGESADYDAACQMVVNLSDVIDAATIPTKTKSQP